MFDIVWRFVNTVLILLLLFALGFEYFNTFPKTVIKEVIIMKEPMADCIEKPIYVEIPKEESDVKNAIIIQEKPKKPKLIIEISEKPYDFVNITLEKRLREVSLALGNNIFIRIFKKEAMLEVWMKDKESYIHLKDYEICAYSGHLGAKVKEGDKQSPEGFYTVDKKALNPHSKFHLSFNLGYPNSYDRAYKREGSFLMVHGNCVSTGCYAMTDEKIEEIYALVEEALKHGQESVQVHAFPFKMTKENMSWYEHNKWYDFWLNLKEGYDYFETEKIPPKIKVEKKRYEIYE
ncbi:probable exported protein STY0357 [hydrothermal vent metagenome]|uniref:Probable exported protein STY0357 n=1 Tax=hydrothermal vent metagenome TaxID=652676 RepID=A0A1W1CK52_9ZZZZ